MPNAEMDGASTYQEIAAAIFDATRLLVFGYKAGARERLERAETRIVKATDNELNHDERRALMNGAATVRQRLDR